MIPAGLNAIDWTPSATATWAPPMATARALVESFRNCSETVPERLPAPASEAAASTARRANEQRCTNVISLFSMRSLSTNQYEFADLVTDVRLQLEDVHAAGQRPVALAQDVPRLLAHGGIVVFEGRHQITGDGKDADRALGRKMDELDQPVVFRPDV